MEKTAKPINRFMLFFLSHEIAVTVLVFAVVYMLGLDYNIYAVQTFGSLLVFLPPLVFYIIYKNVKLKDIIYIKPLGFINFFLIIAITFAVQPLLLFLSSLSAVFFPNTTQEYVMSLTSLPLWAVLITTSVLPAILEESLFRGVLFNKNLDINNGKKILLSAFFFALMHLDPQQFLYTFAAGLIFAYLMCITRSIYAPMLAHFTLNASQTIMVYSSLQTSGAVEAAEGSAAASLIYSVVLLILTLPLMFFAVYLLLINNKDKIALDRVIMRLREISEKQRVKENIKTAGVGQAVSIDKREEKKPRERYGRQILTWEFWCVIIIYAVYIVLLYV